MLHSLFVDFNSYFASVEQQLQPKLRGKPIAVVPVKAETTCCIAASYEAKRLGVKTGTLVAEARKLCPGIHIVEARPPMYVEYHHKLVSAVESCIPVDKVLSIDEMVCTLTGSQQQKEKAIALAAQIKKTISANVGTELKCSIGIAPNQFLAKTATDMQKPDGLVVIDDADLPHCLYRLELRDLCGIGRQTEKRMWRNGIYTVEQLYTAEKALLKKIWGGIEGERMYEKLRGHVVYEAPTHRSVIGHSHVLEPKFRTQEGAYAILHKLLQKATVRMRSYGYHAGAMFVKVKFVNGERWVKELSFDDTSDSVKLLQVLDAMWKSYSCSRTKPIAVAVTLFKLTKEFDHTLSLFEPEHQRTQLNDAVDLLNTKFGKNTIYFGGAHRVLGSAPMRIAFTHIPDLKTESDE